MCEQKTLATATGFEKFTETTRRAKFLAEMNRVVPWGELSTKIEPLDLPHFSGQIRDSLGQPSVRTSTGGSEPCCFSLQSGQMPCVNRVSECDAM